MGTTCTHHLLEKVGGSGSPPPAARLGGRGPPVRCAARSVPGARLHPQRRSRPAALRGGRQCSLQGMDPSAPAASLVPEVATLDPRRMARLRRVGWLLDNSIPIPGTRYTLGIDQLIGLVPGHRRPDRRRPFPLHHRRGRADGRAPRAARPHGLERRASTPWSARCRSWATCSTSASRPTSATSRCSTASCSGRSRCAARAAGSSRCWSSGLLLLTAGAIALAVVLVRLLSGLFQ